MTDRHHDPYAALRFGEFRDLVLSSFLLTIALMMQEVAIGYELYRITHDPLALGMIGLIEAVPFISFSLFGGHFADRYSKRKILLWSVGCIALCSTILQFFSRDQGSQSSAGLLFTIYATIFVIGVCRAFQSPTATSLRAILVPFEHYENAATWSSSAWQIGAVVGPVISGFSYAWFGFSNTLLVVVALVIATFYLYSRIGDRPVPAKKEEINLAESIKEGIGFVLKTKVILYSISLDLFSVLFGGVMAILPIYAQDILRVGPQGLGILRGAPSLGAVITLLILARVSAMEHPWRNLLIAVTGFGVCIVAFAVSPWMLLSVIMLFFSGAFDSVSVVIRHTLLQTLTPDELRGRVMAVNGIFLAASNELGAFESGVAAKLMGTVPSALFGGLMTLAIVTWVYRESKGLFTIQLSKRKK
ncbi:MAG TPA: MFS transporter [Bacteroidota bacterium]|nr:MFS transporter [Bacteroidota bacterium]